MTNKIVILDDSVLLYEHYISDDQWERTLAFPRGGLTYLISNGTIKFYAYEDYFYRNCLISMQLPIYIVDEYMHIDGEYDDLDELVEILDRVFPTNDLDAQLEKYVMKVDADLLYQPIGDYALRSEIPDVSEFVTTDELVEALEDYYTKDEVDTLLDDKADKDDVYTKDEADARFQPIGEYLTSGDTYLKGEIDDKLDDKLDASAYTPTDLSNYYTKDETSGKTEIQNALDLKLDASAYTPTDLSNYYTKQEVDGALDDKLDASAYTPTDLSNYYTKQETSSKTEIDAALNTKADNTKVYTKNETDAKYQVKLVAGDNITIRGNVISAAGSSGDTPVDAYTKAESDARYQLKGSYVTETEFNNTLNVYATKQWVLNQNYVTSSQINQYITNLQQQINSLQEALENCCSGTPTPTTEYRWITLTGSSDYICSGTTKYEKQQKQQSTDGGITWVDVVPAEYQRGNVIETSSDDCGYIEPQYRWKAAPTSDYLCIGDDKYYKVYYEVSYDGGVTWEHVVPEQTKRGDLIQADSPDCGYIEPKYRVWSGTPYCEQYNYVVNTKNQVSYDGGSTWQDTGITGKTVIEYNSKTCGYRNYKAKIVNLGYTQGGTYDKEYYTQCNGASSLISGETKGVYPHDFMYAAQPHKAIYIGHCVDTIGSATFSSWQGVTKVDIADSVVVIEQRAFSGGVGDVTSFTMSNNVQTIGDYAFVNMVNLKSLTLPDTVKSIGYGAFVDMTGCTAVTIGSGVTSIETNAFGDCNSLKSFTIRATTPPAFHAIFKSNLGMYDNYPSGLKIYVPSSSLTAYKNAWDLYKDIIYPIS